MARISSKDPLDKFRWSVTIQGFSRMGFSSCEVPSVTINTQSYAEGGAHLFPRKIIDSVEYKPVTLQRGVTSDMNFHIWASQYIELVRNYRIINPGKDPGEKVIPPSEYRRTVYIEHLNRAGTTIKTYILHNAFPIEYKPASDFSADADDGLSMEKIVLTYEGFEVISNNRPDDNTNDPSDIFKRIIKRL
jgi:phage tail-like protein